MSDDMNNHGVIPCAILVDNFASGLRVIAEGRQDAPYIELISLLDKVEAYIDKHVIPSSFESVGKEFAESLNCYSSILKNTCVGIIKDNSIQ